MRTVFSAAALLAVLAVAQAEVPSVCGMCKEHVSNFVEASHNPIKLAELRATLLHVCAGTSFATDCSLVAGKLDFIARRLAPYMADTEAVCTKFQACPEPDLAGLPQLVVLFLKQSEGRMTFDAAKEEEVCNQCQATAAQAHQFFASQESFKSAKAVLGEHICSAFGAHNNACNEFANLAIPAVFGELALIFGNTAAACNDLGFCRTGGAPISRPVITQPLASIWQKAGTVQGGQQLMSCFECTLSVDALLEEMTNNRVKQAADLRDVICPKFPSNWTLGCNDFLNQYLPTVLAMTYEQFDGKAVCAKMHTCESKGTFPVAAQTNTKSQGCASCSHMQSFFAENALAFHGHAMEAIRENVCQALPVSYHRLCTRVATNVSGRLLNDFSLAARMGALCPAVC